MRLAAASIITICRSSAPFFARAAAQDYRFSSLILGVVGSVPFQMRMKMEAQ